VPALKGPTSWSMAKSVKLVRKGNTLARLHAKPALGKCFVPWEMGWWDTSRLVRLVTDTRAAASATACTKQSAFKFVTAHNYCFAGYFQYKTGSTRELHCHTTMISSPIFPILLNLYYTSCRYVSISVSMHPPSLQETQTLSMPRNSCCTEGSRGRSAPLCRVCNVSLQRMLMRSEELSRMNESFLPREPIYKCTMKAKEEPTGLVLIVDCVHIVYSRVYLLLQID
jgi:hypothetical protein